MRKFPHNSIRPGFTLIEILIVIVIIGILAFIAVSSFGAARKIARLDVAVDSMISLVKEQEGKARTGRVVVGSSGLLCYGVEISTTSPYLQSVTVPYVPVGSSGTSAADYCDTAASSIQETPVVMTQDILVQKICEKDPTCSNKSMVIMFKPPFGTLLIADQLSDIHPDTLTPGVDKNPLKLLLNLQDNTADQARGINYDFVADSIQKYLPSAP